MFFKLKIYKHSFIATILILLLVVSMFSFAGCKKDSPEQNSFKSNNGSGFDAWISNENIQGAWKCTMNFNDIILLVDTKPKFDLDVEASDFKAEETIDVYFYFKDNGKYDYYYYPKDYLDKYTDFYCSYLDNLKNDKDKFLKAFDMTESELLDDIKTSECKSYEDYIDNFKEAQKKWGEREKRAYADVLTLKYEDGQYTIKDDKLYLYPYEGNDSYICYEMKNNELVSVFARSNRDNYSDEDLFHMYKKLVKSSIDLSKIDKKLRNELQGIWITKTGSNKQIIELLNSQAMIFIGKGKKGIKANVKAVSTTSFSLEAEGFSNFTFKYSNGIIKRYKNGIPDGYTYEKTETVSFVEYWGSE